MICITRTDDVATCRRLRRLVFIEEQGVSEADEIDGRDDDAIHLIATKAGRPVGTARLLAIADTGKIGRVCVLKDQRGTGLGQALVRAALEAFREMPEIARVRLGAQSHATGFYERFGFAAEGSEYLDAGIPHRDMVIVLR